jgi:lipopolysaccharide transport system permease protein
LPITPSSGGAHTQTIIEPSKGLLGINLKELWKYRELLWMLALREVSLRYRQTFLGVTWVVLQPLLTTAIFTVIFGTLMNAPSEGLPYSVFAFAGLLPWNLFAQSLQRAGVSLTRDIRLITKIFFPRVIIPIANSISTLVDFFVSCVLMFILMLIYKIPFTFSLLSLPLFLVFNLMLAIGVGLIFAALNVYYRDFTYVLPFVIQVWMFASPLAYSAKLIPESWSWVYSLNPMVGIIDGFRWAIFGTIEFPANSFVFSMVTSLLLFFIGLAVFHRLERKFADVI